MNTVTAEYDSMLTATQYPNRCTGSVKPSGTIQRNKKPKRTQFLQSKCKDDAVQSATKHPLIIYPITGSEMASQTMVNDNASPAYFGPIPILAYSTATRN